MISRSIEWLSSGAAIRFQLAAYANFLHIHSAIENSIERIYWSEYCKPEVVQLDQEKQQDDKMSYNLPRMSPVIKWYNRFSTSCLILILAKSLLPLQRWINQPSIKYHLPNLPSHCFVPGRFILLATMETYFEPLFAGALLIWRLCIMRNRHFNLNLLIFLLQDEALIDRVYRRQTSGDSMPHYEQPAGTRYEQFIRKTLGYSLLLPSRCSIFRIRLNRTPKARAELAAKVAKVGLVTFSTLLASTVTVLLLVIVQLLNDRAYLKRYPNCSRELEELAHQLPWYSVTLSGHKLFTLAFDLAENGVLWFDTLAGGAVTLPFLYLLNQDLIYCWHSIRLQLLELERRLRLAWLKNLLTLKEQARSNDHKLLSRVWASHQAGHQAMRLEDEGHQLSMAVFATQCEVTKFFRQFKQVDQFISDILTASIVVAVATLSFITYSYVIKLGEVTMEARVLQLVAFALLITMSMALFALQKLVAPSYLTLCSIMAYDTSCHKRRHIKILDQFVHDWTLFHTYSYRPTTLMSLVGWTFSGTVIVESLVGRNK